MFFFKNSKRLEKNVLNLFYIKFSYWLYDENYLLLFLYLFNLFEILLIISAKKLSCWCLFFQVNIRERKKEELKTDGPVTQQGEEEEEEELPNHYDPRMKYLL